MAAINEQKLLKKLEGAEAKNETLWPNFILKDVMVVSKTTRQPFNLLSAYRNDQAYVEGVLVESESDDQERHKRQGFGKCRIFLDDVSVYSYGINEDSSLGFWAAGKAGWFQLTTFSKEYRHIYERMEEATLLLYYLSDKVKGQRKKFTKSTPASEVIEHVRLHIRLFRKADENRYGRNTADECHKAFREYRFFLIKCMLEGAEEISNWTSTPYYWWYQREYPEDVAFVKKVVGQKATGPMPIPADDLMEEEEGEEEEEKEEEEEEEDEEEGEDEEGEGGDDDVMDVEEGLQDQPLPVTPVAARKKLGANQGFPQPQPRQGTRATRATRLNPGVTTPTSNEPEPSGEVDPSKAKTRSKHKRKSILRPIGAKTPSKTNKRKEGLRAYRNPSMEDIRNNQLEQNKEDMSPESSDVEAEGEGSDPEDEAMEDEEDEDDESEDEQAGGSSQPSREYYEPKGPDSTWTCPIDGCSHQVWDARSPLGKSLIQQHYAKNHTESIEDLVKSEERPWANVSNLLAKIQSLKEAQGLLKGVSRKY